MAYAVHSCNFLATELLLWTRLSFILGYDFLSGSDWLCAGILVLGLLLGTPYVFSVIRASEVVVDGGPSLINELLPDWISTAVLFCLLVIVFIADRCLQGGDESRLGILLYLLIGITGLIYGILSVNNHNNRVLASVTMIFVCLHQLERLDEVPLPIVPSMGLFLSYLFDALTTRVTRDQLDAHELSTLRARMVAKLGLSGTILLDSLNPVSIFLVVLIYACDCIEHVHERKHGSLDQRRYLQAVAVRHQPFQTVD